MSVPTRVRVFAPGSIGNVGPGLDILGLAFAGVGDTLLAERLSTPGIVIREAGHPELPTDPARHSSAVAAQAVLRHAGAPRAGMAFSLTKGLPLSGGQGGSAASAVVGAVAANALLGSPLDAATLIDCCLEAEAAVSGRHADNIAPSLLGGLVLVRSVDPVDVIPIPVPRELTIVLAHSDQRLRTQEARAVLPRDLPLGIALAQAANIAAMVAACAAGDLSLLSRALDDRIAEPVRSKLLPGFQAAKAAAIGAGALGASISGAGPTSFALCAGRVAGDRVAAAMRTAYAASGVAATVRVTEPDLRGAVIEVLA